VEQARTAHVPLQLTGGAIVASIQLDLSDEMMHQFRSDLLTLVASSGATRIILDLSWLSVLDLDEFRALEETAAMAGLLGARTVTAGLRPGVVASLVEMDAPLDWVEGALDLEQAFRLFDAAPVDAESEIPVVAVDLPPEGAVNEPE